jgi:predicted DNA binding CopG/RHH family protein
MKALQTFADEYLQRCKELSIEEKLDFIENFRLMHSELNSPSKLISLKVPEPLLHAFKQKAKLENIAYQTKIKQLMKNWLSHPEA